MVGIGEGAGRKCTAYLTGMDQPLGFAIGNAVEVKEAIETLNGSGPADLTELVLALGSEMLVLAGIAADRPEAEQMLQHHLAEKKAARKFQELIKAQGGNPAVVENLDLLPRAEHRVALASEQSGVVQEINALGAGMAAKVLGAGRQTKEQDIDLSIGIVLEKKVGDAVQTGETLAILHADGDRTKIDSAAERLLNAYVIGPGNTDPGRLIQARVASDFLEEFGR